MKHLLICGLAVILAFGQSVPAQNAKAKQARKPRVEQYDTAVPQPTLSAVRYGKHERHILDFWQAESTRPTPVAFVIHGGGWQNGAKERLQRFADAPRLLKAGISVVAINYRYVKQAEELEIKPPVKAPLHDAARAFALYVSAFWLSAWARGSGAAP